MICDFNRMAVATNADNNADNRGRRRGGDKFGDFHNNPGDSQGCLMPGGKRGSAEECDIIDAIRNTYLGTIFPDCQNKALFLKYF